MSTTPDKNFRLEQACASDDSIQQVHGQLRKQKPDKASGYPFLPLGILGLMCSAVFFSSIYLAHYSIRFDPLVVNEHAKREKPGAMVAPTVTPAMLGKKVSVRPVTNSPARASPGFTRRSWAPNGPRAMRNASSASCCTA